MRQTLVQVDSRRQKKKSNFGGTRLKTPWKKWTHIDLCKSPEKGKKKQPATTFVRCCLGDAAVNGEHKEWHRKTKPTKPRNAFEKGTNQSTTSGPV